ncbi:hypothetical protein [Dyadobacter sp. LHD-138]|uniref:hypothetical protein n=1 Tax=Dyadobacter sp. LHD-138 TaxID=3071413 RepID=UPI0027DEBF97|nr:hypothetical protein [Dyadobacter sp. LHD-138]MDQ6478131.1 hypothetical protein [Dyadobacter sp. LHD-138]
MKLFLQLKHWQLFGLIFGFPVVFQFFSTDIFINNTGSPLLIGFSSALMIVVSIVYFGWFYTLGTWLHKRLPAQVKLNLNRFKFCIFFPIGYMLVIFVAIGGAVTHVLPAAQFGFGVFMVILPVHLFAMTCILYCFRFNAKALKSVEWMEPVKFADYAGEFFLIWFFPLGGWFIQPRINKLLEDSQMDGIVK